MTFSYVGRIYEKINKQIKCGNKGGGTIHTENSTASLNN